MVLPTPRIQRVNAYGIRVGHRLDDVLHELEKSSADIGVYPCPF